MKRRSRTGRPAHLTDQQAEEIRALKRDGWTLVVIAEMYGVTPGAVSRIVNNLTHPPEFL
jgi:hypothetical protein